jgi:hypothetical protein
MLKLKEILRHVEAKGDLMTKCPYTWTKSLLSRFATKGHEASQLRVTVLKNNELAVDTALPAHSARWLVDLIPDDVLEKISRTNSTRNCSSRKAISKRNFYFG